MINRIALNTASNCNRAIARCLNMLQDDLKATDALYVQAIARDLEQVLQTAPDLATPNALQHQLDQLSQQLNCYIRLHLRLDKMKDLVAMLEGEQRYEWEDHADELAQRSQMILPIQEAEMQTMQAIASLWQTANGRLKLFYLSSYLISFTVLAGGGFNQLYWAKPTFRANGWGDYFALLALGFGAEATRNMVTQVANKTDASTP